jgi:GDP-L-fucose synthase
MESKIITTGSRGLLGSALKKQLGDGHLYLTSKDLDLKDSLDTHANIYSVKDKYDTIIHCAAKVGGVKANMENNDLFFWENYQMNNSILESAYRSKYKNFVSILSTCIFPDDVEYPLTADKINLGAPHPTNYGYSYAKRLLGYQTSIFGNMIPESNWISVVPTNLYGSNDNFNLNDSHLIPALIRKAYDASISGGDFVVWGDGTPLRQFVYSDDMAQIILWAIDNWKSDVPLMAVNEKEYSIKEVSMIIANRFGISENKIIFDKTKPNGQFRKPAKSDVNWFEFTPLEVGLNKTIDWFIENYNTNNIRI